MTAGTDIWVIKTVHKECPYQTEWDPSEYYTDHMFTTLKNKSIPIITNHLTFI